MATDKQQLQIPDLPSVVQGDGRHVMALLRKYLKEMAVQINLANDFEGEPEQDTGLAAPAGFVLRFGVDGGEFSWKDVPYLSSLAYYELRTDRNVGNKIGLLEQTTEVTSTKLPPNYQATIYLYAILKDGTFSNASILTYTKARPEAPQKINLTKNDQGTLIQFTEIPIDCIGANVYVNDEKVSVTDNLYLFQNTSNVVIDTVSVAYYDQFGEGEKATISCYVPLVTSFIVERNGAVLDFYWDEIALHGVQYMVQVAESPVWGSGTVLFTTKQTKKKMEYPNPGGKYFLIKAFDEHGNYSAEAVYYHLVSAEDPTRNHIVTYDKQAESYPDTKYRLWYDVSSGGLQFTDGCYVGDYVFGGMLPQKYRARNWVDYKVLSVEEETWYVQDALYELDSEWATSITVSGGRISEGECVDVKTYIATYNGIETNGIMATSNGLNPVFGDGVKGSTAYAWRGYTVAPGRWGNGIKPKETARGLMYKATYDNRLPYNIQFTIKYEEPPQEGFIFSDGTVSIHFDDGAFCLNQFIEGKKEVLSLPYVWKRIDAVTFGVSVSATEVRFFIKSADGAAQASMQCQYTSRYMNEYSFSGQGYYFNEYFL